MHGLGFKTLLPRPLPAALDWQLIRTHSSWYQNFCIHPFRTSHWKWICPSFRVQKPSIEPLLHLQILPMDLVDLYQKKAKKPAKSKESLEEGVPYDIAYEILSRITSLKTLDASKAVCKSWNRIILQPCFMPSYSQNTDNMFGYIVQDKGNCRKAFFSMNERHIRSRLWAINEKLNLSLERLSIRASSLQGILFGVHIKAFPDAEFCVCKLNTWEFQEIPSPGFILRGSIFGLMILGSKPLHYKIVLISRATSLEPDLCMYHCHIFDSKTWEWKKIFEKSWPKTYFSQPVYAGGSLFILFDFNCILCVRGNDEAINYMTTPGSVDLPVEHHLTEYQGKLALICKTALGLLNLWVLEDAAKTQKWRKIKQMDLGFAAGSIFDFHAFHFYNSNILFMMSRSKGVFCNLQDSTYKQIMNVFDARYVFPFRSDWEPVDLIDNGTAYTK